MKHIVHLDINYSAVRMYHKSTNKYKLQFILTAGYIMYICRPNHCNVKELQF